MRPCFEALASRGFIFCDLYNDCLGFVDGTARAGVYTPRAAGPATESLLFCVDFFIADGGTAIGIPDLAPSWED